MRKQSPGLEQGSRDAVEVYAPARLHLGFLDLNGGLGRRYGSLGLTLEGIGTRLTLTRVAAESGEAASPRAERMLAALASRYGALFPLSLRVSEAIREHVGLGSGTQLGLALAAGVAALAGEPVSARTLAALVERGARSGIGIGAFDMGGFLVDGGKHADAAPAPIIARAAFPADWRVILIFDEAGRGLSGTAEKAAFAALPPFPEMVAAQLCRLTLLRLLPGLAEADFAAFASSVGEIGALLGDYFAPVQGGRYSSPPVAAVLRWLAEAGYAGIGQSSWGPTGFVFVEDPLEAQALEGELTRRFAGAGALAFRAYAGRNRGAEIRRVAGKPHSLGAAKKAGTGW
jgi:beta-RFAP synthase